MSNFNQFNLGNQMLPMGVQPLGGVQPLQGTLMPQMPAMAPNMLAGQPFGNIPGMPLASGMAPVTPGQNIVSNTQASTIVIRKIMLVETKPQQNQYSRNYVPLVDRATLMALDNFKDQSPDMRVTATDVANMQANGAQFFGISAQPNGMVGMANGWATRRFRFTLTADVYFNGMHYCTEYVAGYSDHYGVSSGNSLDPNMLFVINSVTRSSPRPITGSTTGVGHAVTSANMVIADNNPVGFGAPNQIRLSRPSDVFAEMSVLANRRGAEFLAGQTATMGGAANTSYINMNTAVGAEPRLSNVDNNMISNYAARLLDSTSVVAANADETKNPYSSARSLVSEEAYSSSFFTHMLDEKTGNFSGAVGNTFTLGRLYGIDPALANSMDDRITVVTSDVFAREITRTATGQAITVPAGTSCDSFSGTGTDVPDAIAIMQAACSQFRRAGVSYISCRLTNYSGVDNYAISSLMGIDDGLLASRATKACETIIRDCVLAVTRRSASYQIDLVIDIDNDAYVKIAIATSAPREFVIPCFALASLSPVLANQSSLDNIVTGVKNITGHLFQDVMVIGDTGNGFNTGSVSY